MFDNFVQTDANKSRDARNALNSSRQKSVEENRNRLSNIIRTIEFCGRQEIPLRDHRDAGAFSLNETDCNGGVFKAALTLSVRIFYTDLKQNLRRWNMFWWIKVVQLAVSVVFSLIFAYQNWDNFVPTVPRQYYTVAQICPYSSILSLNR